MATGGTTSRKTDTFGKTLWLIACYTGLPLTSEPIRTLSLVSRADSLGTYVQPCDVGRPEVPPALIATCSAEAHNSMDTGDHDAARGYIGATTQMQRSDHPRG